MHKAVAADNAADLDPALQHFRQVIAINPDLDQAKIAKQNIAAIQKALGPQ
jgi:predicted negative regulator of RcsB-dependent stress response